MLTAAGHWSGAVNRAYDAMFYGASALLTAKGLAAVKHSGVLALIDREFVHTGSLPAELSRKLRAAFLLRQESDYGALTARRPQ